MLHEHDNELGYFIQINSLPLAIFGMPNENMCTSTLQRALICSTVFPANLWFYILKCTHEVAGKIPFTLLRPQKRWVLKYCRHRWLSQLSYILCTNAGNANSKHYSSPWIAVNFARNVKCVWNTDYESWFILLHRFVNAFISQISTLPCNRINFTNSSRFPFGIGIAKSLTPLFALLVSHTNRHEMGLQ